MTAAPIKPLGVASRTRSPANCPAQAASSSSLSAKLTYAGV